ncbi:MAG TPA: dihydroorotate dehydrogenase electron transfer subunit [Bacteroidales bacterium]|nr:dihydroorotate dehydrogenase electron transfer subunit [Bacteroidales bacterium]
MKKYINDFEIVYNLRLNKDYFILKLMCEDELPAILPAQFAEVKIEDSASTFLRRPISIHDVNYDKNTITLLIRLAGQGTSKLAEKKSGELVSLVYPLGNSFSLPIQDKVLLIGGGCGVAPMLYTAKYFMQFGFMPTLLLGYRDKESILRKEKFGKYGNVFYTTEDGSFGEKGTVIDHSLLNSEVFEFKRIYACGPEAMLKNVADKTRNKNVVCEVSLENMMACGIGACLCCVQNTVNGHRCVCTEGPVFNTKDIIW